MHYRHVAGFSDNDIEKSPWAAGKACCIALLLTEAIIYANVSNEVKGQEEGRRKTVAVFHVGSSKPASQR